MVDEPVHVGDGAAAPRLADELEEARRELLAAVRLLLDQRQVRREVLERVQRAERGILRALAQRLRAPRDGGEGVVQLVGDAGDEPARRGEALGEEHLALQSLLQGDVLDEDQGVRGAAARGMERRAGEPEGAGVTALDHDLLGVAHLPALEDGGEEAADALHRGRRARGRGRHAPTAGRPPRARAPSGLALITWKSLSST